jgi:hypothetical protein
MHLSPSIRSLMLTERAVDLDALFARLAAMPKSISPSGPSSTQSHTGSRASHRRAATSSRKQTVLSMGVPKSARCCRKHSRIGVQSPSSLCLLSLLLGWHGGAEVVEDAEVGEEKVRRSILAGGSDNCNDLDRLGDSDMEAEGRERWERAEEPRPGVRVAEEAGPVVGVCA